MAIMSNSTIKFQKIYNPFKESLKLRLVSIASNIKRMHIYQRITVQVTGLNYSPKISNGVASAPLRYERIFHNVQCLLCCEVWDLSGGVHKIICICHIGMSWSLFLWFFEITNDAIILPFTSTGDLKQNHMDGVIQPINMILKCASIEFVRSIFFTETSTMFWPEITFKALRGVIGQAHVSIMDIKNLKVVACI